MEAVKLLEAAPADQVMDLSLSVLEFVPLNAERQGGAGLGSDLRSHSWICVLDAPNRTMSRQFLVWNDAGTCSSRISRILIPCHWNRVMSDGGPLLAVWSMSNQLIVLDVPSGLAWICPFPSQLAQPGTIVLATCAVGSSTACFQLLVVYALRWCQGEFYLTGKKRFHCTITALLFDSSKGGWEVRRSYHGRQWECQWPFWCPGATGVLVGSCLHLRVRLLWLGLRYDIRRDTWEDAGQDRCPFPIKWCKGQVTELCTTPVYRCETNRMHVESPVPLPPDLTQLQPQIDEGTTNIRLRSDGIIMYALFSCRGCVEIIYMYDINAGTWWVHHCKRLRDLGITTTYLHKSSDLAPTGHWASLPSDILQEVAQLLCTARELKAFSMVCQNWHASLSSISTYQEPMLVFWNNKKHALFFFRSDKGWSRLVQAKDFFHHAPIICYGPLLISWESSKVLLHIVNVSCFSRRTVHLADDHYVVAKVGCISHEKVLVILLHTMSWRIHLVPAVVTLSSIATSDQWQLGSPFAGGYCPLQKDKGQDDESVVTDSDNLVILGSHAYFVQRSMNALEPIVVLQYNWETDQWGSVQPIDAGPYDHTFVTQYQIYVKRPLIHLHGKLAMVAPTMDVCFVGGCIISRMPESARARLVQVLDASLEYTSGLRLEEPKKVVITVCQCTNSIHMLCRRNSVLVAIILWDNIRDLWGVISLSHNDDRLWLQDKFFALCLDTNSPVSRYILSVAVESRSGLEARRAWVEFFSSPWKRTKTPVPSMMLLTDKSHENPNGSDAMWI